MAPDTVMRDSRLAKAWLARELSAENNVTPDAGNKSRRSTRRHGARRASEREAFLAQACGGDEGATRGAVAARPADLRNWLEGLTPSTVARALERR